HQLKPDIGGGIARRWYDVDQVDLIVDVPVSAVGLAVQNIANEKKKLFITHSTLAADFHGKFCSPYAMQWVIDTRSLAAGTAAAPPNNMNEIKTGSEFGIFKGGQQMAALLALITDIHSLGLPAAQGLLLTTSFYWDMDDKTREWSKRYFAKMNRMPTMWQAGVYSSVMYYLNAIKESGTDEPLKVAAKMREKPIEDFFARNGKLREDNLMVHDLMLVQVKKPEESKYPWDYYKILAKISGEDAFGPPDPACAMAKK